MLLKNGANDLEYSNKIPGKVLKFLKEKKKTRYFRI